ncbi:MAG TPA: FAD-dependent oxidoreductase [Polyangia bacterium]|jgi:protoporphyrinogen oxidase
MRHVIVLGGGACGLTAAYQLARAGCEVTVLERESRPGGLCGTHERSGFRFDFGGHRFLSRSPALEALVRELVGGDLLLRRRSSAVLYRGRRFRYPLELDEVVRKAGFVDGARALASYGAERARQLVAPAPDLSFRDWVTHRFGRVLYDAFFGPYTEKLWGISPSEISADWASQRISLLSLGDVALRLFGLRRGGSRSYARRYLYPRRGIGQIFERMAEETRALGGEVRLGAEVIGLSHSRGRVRRIAWRDGRGEHERACDAVISTVALPKVARMLGGRALPREVERSADRLRFRGIRLCNVLLDGPEVSPHTWMYVSSPEYAIARIQEPRHRSPEMAPPGCTSLMLELPCDPGSQRWTAPEETIYEQSMDELGRLGFSGLRARTREHFSSFVVEGYPIYHLDYRRDREKVLGFVGATENLVSCGRQGAFRYLFMDTAMEMGLAAADAILRGGRGDRISELRSGGGLIEAKALTA